MYDERQKGNRGQKLKSNTLRKKVHLDLRTIGTWMIEKNHLLMTAAEEDLS